MAVTLHAPVALTIVAPAATQLGVVGWSAVGLVALAALGFWLWMLVDVLRTPDGAFRTGSKLLWVLLILLTGIGAPLYFLLGRPAAPSRV